MGFSTHFARWYTPLVIATAAALFLAGGWPSAVGVLVGALMFLLKTRRVRYAMRSPLTGAQQHSGMLVYAASQALIGLVCVFIGALFTNHLVLLFSAAFGTWQLSMAAFLAVVIRVARRS